MNSRPAETRNIAAQSASPSSRQWAVIIFVLSPRRMILTCQNLTIYTSCRKMTSKIKIHSFWETLPAVSFKKNNIRFHFLPFYTDVQKYCSRNAVYNRKVTHKKSSSCNRFMNRNTQRNEMKLNTSSVSLTKLFIYYFLPFNPQTPPTSNSSTDSPQQQTPMAAH